MRPLQIHSPPSNVELLKRRAIPRQLGNAAPSERIRAPQVKTPQAPQAPRHPRHRRVKVADLDARAQIQRLQPPAPAHYVADGRAAAQRPVQVQLPQVHQPADLTEGGARVIASILNVGA